MNQLTDRVVPVAFVVPVVPASLIICPTIIPNARITNAVKSLTSTFGRSVGYASARAHMRR